MDQYLGYYTPVVLCIGGLVWAFTCDLRRLPFLAELSRATRRVINQNFLLGIGFVLGGMLLGAMRYLSPIVAAMFHVAGSLLVVFNSFRLMRLGEDLESQPDSASHLQFPAPVGLRPTGSRAISG